MKNPKITLAMVGMIVLAIIVLAIIFDRCQERKQAAIVPQTIIAQVDKVKETELKFLPVIDSLKAVNGHLHEKDSLNKKAVTELQKENRRLAKQAEAHIDSMGLYEPPDSNENDYAGNTKELIAAAAASDSACNETIRNLDSTIVVSGKIISQKDSLYNFMKQSFDNSIYQQKLLYQKNQKLEAKVKNKNTLLTIIGGVAIVLGGILLAK